jgi:thiol-disulfide isomerase/thioredoxin
MAGAIAAAAVEGPTPGGVAIATAYVVGAIVPLAAVAIGGRAIARRLGGATRALRVRQGYGLLMIVAGVAIVGGFDLRLQAALAAPPSGAGASVTAGSTSSDDPAGPGDVAGVPSVQLDDLGPAPELGGITSWINSEPLTMASLRGKVVLVHFWTFACINCIHVQPYVKTWFDKYGQDGFVVVGVHTPELSFERDVDNVRDAVSQAGVRFPVAFDPAFTTWRAYGNHAWPAFYFVGRDGRIRHTHVGEGDYDGSEAVIRELLAES